MPAVRKYEAFNNNFNMRKPIRDIEPADYSDVVTDDDLSAVQKLSDSILDKDEWVMIDGPAW